MIKIIPGIDKGECTPENLEKIKSLVPKALEEYVIRKLFLLILRFKINSVNI